MRTQMAAGLCLVAMLGCSNRTDVTGSWQVAIVKDKADDSGMHFRLTQDGVVVNGTVTIGDQEFVVEQGTLRGDILTFSYRIVGEGTVSFMFQVKGGDQMHGRITTTEGNGEEWEATAERVE